MQFVTRTRRGVRTPIWVAVALALASTTSIAAPAPTQMPGAGLVTNVSNGATVNGSGAGLSIVNLVPGTSILLSGAANGRAVIQWGGAGTSGLGEVANPAGFNIGSAGKLTFNNVGGGVAAVLNIDASGNPSEIYGAMNGVATSLFVANGNGIIVGPSGHIASPGIVSLIGADLNNAIARKDFVRDNSVSLGTSFIDILDGQSTVSIQAGATINGDAALNVPASNILLLGGDIVNAGSLNATAVNAFPGLRAALQGPERRFWNVDADQNVPLLRVGNFDFSDNMEIVTVSSFVNTGSIVAGAGEIRIFAGGDIRSGTSGDTNPAVGLFTNSRIALTTFDPSSTIEVYNVIGAGAPGAPLKLFDVNFYDGATGKFIVNALTAPAQPSSITTSEEVRIRGTTVEIDSTINHLALAAGKSQVVNISGTDVTINAPIGGAVGVSLHTSYGGNITINSDMYGGQGISVVTSNYPRLAPEPGTINILGNIVAGTGVDVETYGLLNIAGNVNAGSGSSGFVAILNAKPETGTWTTISGNIRAGSDISIATRYPIQYLPETVPRLVVSGALSAGNDITVQSNGQVSLGQATAGHAIFVYEPGNKVELTGALTAGSRIDVGAPFATTTLLPAAVLTAPFVSLDVLNFRGVNADGSAYTTVAEKPTVQIVTNTLGLQAFGSINAPVSGSTNWLDNAMSIAPLTSTAPIAMHISAVGNGFQAINLRAIGNAVVDSGNTMTPFIGVDLVSPATLFGPTSSNGGSQLIINATGNLDVVQGYNPSHAPADAFQFPGGVVFKAGGVLTVLAPVYNAWTTEALPYQGVFFEAPTITMQSYVATSGNTWGNWSVLPTSGTPTVYQVKQDSPTLYVYARSPDAVHKNSYSALILGSPVCFVPAPGAWSVCP